MTPTCPLCNQLDFPHFHRDPDRTYYRCQHCQLVFVAPADRLDPADEKARYDLHENTPDDEGYRSFLRQLLKPLTRRLGPPPLKGLDFGSGPGPTLSIMLEELGYTMHIYDPFYAPDATALHQTYDFITCTETFEHFYHPGQVWQELLPRIKPGGWLGIMTRLMEDPAAFPRWHYKNDDTHVCFFSRHTFNFLADRDHLSIEIIGENVILMQLSAKPKP